jgi:hypothetical protein
VIKIVASVVSVLGFLYHTHARHFHVIMFFESKVREQYKGLNYSYLETYETVREIQADKGKAEDDEAKRKSADRKRRCDSSNVEPTNKMRNTTASIREVKSLPSGLKRNVGNRFRKATERRTAGGA